MSEGAATGRLIGGRYLLGGPLGRGGMAEVYAAVDQRLERPVAVKLLLAASAAADAERFAAEIRTLARLEHPCIVRLLDAGNPSDDHAYLVMELVEGASLAALCAAGPLPEQEVARVGAGIAAGLAYVHERGVVHRDVKPANILLGPEDRVRLADFGIARLVDTGGLTATGLVLGTPAYLAPEQVSGATVGPPADVYALGLVLAECLLGRRVFDGSGAEAAAARLHAAPLELEGVPARFRPLLSEMTAADPARRPPAAESGHLLRRLADHLAAGEARASVVDTVVLGTATTTVPLPIPERPPSRPAAMRPAAWLAGLALVGLLVGLWVGGAFDAKPSKAISRTTSYHRNGSSAALSRRTHPAKPAPTSTTGATSTTSTTTTSTTSTTTTTSPPTTTDAGGTAAASAAARSLVAALGSGVQAGTVDPAVADQLLGDLQGFGHPGPVAAVVARLGSDFDQAVASGGITGSSVGAVQAPIDALAAALGAPTPPAPSATPVTTAPGPTAPGPPAGGGPGDQGNGHGPHHGHF